MAFKQSSASDFQVVLSVPMWRKLHFCVSLEAKVVKQTGNINKVHTKKHCPPTPTYFS